MTGIDISQHTGLVDFDVIRNSHIDFVYMKASEGGDYIDPFFDLNYTQAAKTTLALGSYHLFRYNVPGVTQANNYLTAIKGKKFHLPLVVDVEEGKPREKYIRETVTKEIKVFISELQKAGYPNVIIYTNKRNYTIFIDDELRKYDLWIAHLDKNPPTEIHWLFWQHWLNTKIPGAGVVDINTFNGSREDWVLFLDRMN